jgi:peptidoglycan/LPS O-acetylase OafA/YrhL
MQKIEKQYVTEIVTAVLLMVLLIAFLHPSGLLMPKSLEMILLVLFILASLIFLALIWKEHPIDERDRAHQLSAGRFSFFAGSIGLTFGITVQALNHNIDPWLVIGLGAMILTKVIARIYTQITQ